MIELSDELRQALNEHPDTPVRIVDTLTNKTFVLVQSEVYERISSLFDDDLDPRVGMAMMNKIMAEDDQYDP
jgi:hypothetical protein